MRYCIQPARSIIQWMSIGFQRIGTVAIQALERARSLGFGKQRKDQKGPQPGQVG
jgi:hypothetical protein